MSEKTLFLFVIIFIILPAVYFLFAWLIPNWINDNKWETYMTAWDSWKRNGEKGEMPIPEDYGYKGIDDK